LAGRRSGPEKECRCSGTKGGGGSLSPPFLADEQRKSGPVSLTPTEGAQNGGDKTISGRRSGNVSSGTFLRPEIDREEARWDKVLSQAGIFVSQKELWRGGLS